MRLVRFISARLQEASTYAGLSALCLAISSALNQSGACRWIALFGAMAAAVGAIAKTEKNQSLANAMNQAIQLVPILTQTVEKVEASMVDKQNVKPGTS
ncbi:hypothetical protein [Lichenicoccus sp.]|uniref:hypothetical protein n=1 Tax=Lichenicoccus sp. TaxID=2781899 RepID=UPI003D132064